MLKTKHHVTVWFIVFMVIAFLIPAKANAKQSVAKYSVSAVRIKKFKKTGSHLTITATEKFHKNNKEISKKRIRFKIAKKCKWRRRNYGIRYPEYKGVYRANYKKLKQYVQAVKGLPENGYYSLVIRVKKKRIISVEFYSML